MHDKQTIKSGLHPNIIINWEQDSGNEVTLPIGLGVNRTFQMGKVPVRVGAEIYYSVIQPDARRGQASACFLFEFGNGEKLIFDLGTGAMRNINALMIPTEYLTKIFISHLHTDHWGDLASLWDAPRHLRRTTLVARGG